MSQAFHDFIRPGEEDLYAELDRSLRAELSPVGILENTLVDEIRIATWRLRRCGLVEAALAAAGSEDNSKTRQAVDRARNLYQRLLHRNTAELRKLQTNRVYRNVSFADEVDHSDDGLTDFRAVRKALDEQFRADYHRKKFRRMQEIDALLSMPVPKVPSPGSFCKTQTGHATSVAA